MNGVYVSLETLSLILRGLEGTLDKPEHLALWDDLRKLLLDEER